MGRLKAQGYFYGQPEDADAVRTRLKAAGKLLNPGREAAVVRQDVGKDTGGLRHIARP